MSFSRRPHKLVCTRLYEFTDRRGGYAVRVTGFDALAAKDLRGNIEMLEGVDTLDEAREWRDQIYSDLKAARYRPGCYPTPGQTWREFFEELLGDRIEFRGSKKRTIDALRYTVEPFLLAHGVQQVCDLTYPQIREGWYTVLRDLDVAQSTRRRMFSDTKWVVSAANGAGLLPYNPFLRLISPASPPPNKQRAVGDANVAAVLAWYLDRDVETIERRRRGTGARRYLGQGAALWLTYVLGRRPGEVLAMREEDFDLAERVVLIRGTESTFGHRDTKDKRFARTGEYLRLPVTDDILKMYAWHMEMRGLYGHEGTRPQDGCDLVFPSKTGRISETGSRFKKSWSTCRAELGLPDTFYPSSLRGEAASRYN